MPELSPIKSYAIPREINSNVTDWHVDPDRVLLLFHDMQHYFLRPFTENSNPASALVSNSVRIRLACIAANIPIAYTAQPGDMTPEQRGLLNDIWGAGMKATPNDRQVITPLAPRPEDWLLTKWRYSAFVKTDLLARMQAAGRDQLIICGVYAHVGILATALEAFSSDIQPFVISDATADFSYEDHTMALEYASRRCAMVMPTESLLLQLEICS